MSSIISFFLIVVGIIHLLPLIGVAGSERLKSLYGIDVEERNLLILMRHRAILFGLFGVFLIYAAFRPDIQLMAILAGLASVVSFICISRLIGGYNSAIHKVIVIDIVAVIMLVIAAILYVIGY